MSLFRKKKQDATLGFPAQLITNVGYSISAKTIISRDDCMIFRCAVRMPFDADENIGVAARNLSGENVAKKCIFMGINEVINKVNGKLVFKEFSYSILIPYPEQDLMLEVFTNADHRIIHQQCFGAQTFRDLRASEDAILYNPCERDPYYNQHWLLEVNRPSVYELYVQQQEKLYFMPKFSIVVPLFQSNLSYLTQLLDSIYKQSYANWELVFVNASPEIPQLKAGLDRLQNEEARIRVVELAQNEGITLNTAHGIEAATGDFVCFVDHDDLIEPNALFEYAQRINEKPDTDVLYCDEDKLFPDGHYGEVYFKPDFSLQFLRTCNYVSHMLAIKTSLLKALDYKNPAFDGAQDHHLVLQAAEKTKHIEHVSRVLYHWRVSASSTAESAAAKPYAANARLNATQAHLQRCGIRAKVEQHPKIEYATRIDYELPQPEPKVSIIIPTKDHVNLLKCCISSILEKSTYSNYEIIVVENNSEQKATFAYYEQLSAHPNVKVVEFNEPFNFSKLVNFGRKNASGDYILLLNNDTEVITGDWLEKMLGLCIQPEVGIVGVKLLFPDDTIQHAGVFAGCLPLHYFRNLPNGASSYHNFADSTRELSGVTAACMMVSAETYDEVGGFDETLEVAYNDVDFCLRVRETGKTAIYEPAVELYHYESISRGYCQEVDTAARLIREKSRMWSDWSYAFTLPDPYCTPNVRQGWEGAYYKF